MNWLNKTPAKTLAKNLAARRGHLNVKRIAQAVTACAAFGFVAACGGGGDSNSTPPGGVTLQVVSFGDSLSDVGTYSPVATADFGGGRFTTNPGQIWVQNVAQYYGGTVTPAQTGGLGIPLSPAGGESSNTIPQPGASPKLHGEPPPKLVIEDSIEPTVYRFILRHSFKQQIMLLVLTLVSFPFLYYSLDLPKTIINRAIGGKHFPQEFLGFEFDQIPYLAIMCGIFLALVFINGAFKFYINTLKGQLGERMLRRFRYALYLRLLRFPTTYFQKTSSAQIIPMITTECDQLGGFIGDEFVLPAFQGGTLLTLIVFMFIQDPILGTAAVALYPLQGWIIPKLQRIVNQLQRRRILTVRQILELDRGSVIRMNRSAGENLDVRIGGALVGFGEIVVNEATTGIRLADFQQNE